MKTLSCLLLSILLSTNTFSQTTGRDNLGKEFYIAFGANQGSGRSNPNDTNLFALYLTGPVPTTGYVEVPAINFQTDFTITPGEITTIPLPDGYDSPGPSVEVTASETIMPGMGVHIIANAEITVYGISHKEYSSDAFIAIPVDVLGREYRTLCYPTSWAGGFGSNSRTPGEFWIISPHDSNVVTITPSAKTSNARQPLQAFSITINRGDVYLVQGDVEDTINDLTGSLIKSELPIAVFSGHVRAAIPANASNLDPDDTSQTRRPSRDHLVEQLPPIDTWGDSVIVIPYATSTGPDLVRIVSAKDNNRIVISQTDTIILNAGAFHEIGGLTGPTTIIANAPILVGQYMHTSKYGLDPTGSPHPVNTAYGDPSLTIVSPVEQFAKGYAFSSIIKKVFQDHFINVIVEQSGSADMLLDGVPIPSAQFQSIAGSNYVFIQVPIQQGVHTISGAHPFGTTVYGFGAASSYAYTGYSYFETLTPLKIENSLNTHATFLLGYPYPDPVFVTNDVQVAYYSHHPSIMQWKLYDELGTVHHTAPEQHIDKGMGTLLIDQIHVRSSGLYFIEVTVRDPHSQLVGRYVTKFAVTD